MTRVPADAPDSADEPAPGRPEASPGEASGAHYVEHVAVAVRDADSAAVWYHSRLGLEVVRDEKLPEIGVRLVYLMAGTTRHRSWTTAIQLLEPLGDGAVEEFLARQGEGLHHVCFVVDDIRSTTDADAYERGAAIFRGGRDRRACFLRQSPNGVLVELTEIDPFYAPEAP